MFSFWIHVDRMYIILVQHDVCEIYAILYSIDFYCMIFPNEHMTMYSCILQFSIHRPERNGLYFTWDGPGPPQAV